MSANVTSVGQNPAVQNQAIQHPATQDRHATIKKIALIAGLAITTAAIAAAVISTAVFAFFAVPTIPAAGITFFLAMWWGATITQTVAAVAAEIFTSSVVISGACALAAWTTAAISGGTTLAFTLPEKKA